MSSFALDSTVAVSENQISTSIDETVVVLNYETGEYLGLHGVGPRVWELLQEAVTVRELVGTIADEYDATPNRCERDILAFLEELVEDDLVEIEDAAAR